MNETTKKKTSDPFKEFIQLVEEMNKPTPVHNASGQGVVKSADVTDMSRQH